MSSGVKCPSRSSGRIATTNPQKAPQKVPYHVQARYCTNLGHLRWPKEKPRPLVPMGRGFGHELSLRTALSGAVQPK